MKNAPIKDVNSLWIHKINGNWFILERLSVWAQGFLWFIGIAVHNCYRNECTPDFNCCIGGENVRKCFVRLTDTVHRSRHNPPRR